MIEVQTQVSQNTEALKGAQTEVNDLRRQLQTLEIELESQKSLVRSTQSAHTSFTPTHAYLHSLRCLTQQSHFKSLTVTLLTQALHSSEPPLWSCRRLLGPAVKCLTPSLSLFPQKASLESTLMDTEIRYNMEIESLNNIILGLEAELTKLRTDIKQQAQDYEALLNTKMKLEAEIATYRRLLDGEDFQYVPLQGDLTFFDMNKTCLMAN